jgi:hypothetical protein
MLSKISIGQEVNDSLLTVFYNKTLEYYFPDSVKLPDQKKFGHLLIMTDFPTAIMLKKRGRNKFKYFKNFNELDTLLAKPYKKNDKRNLYWIKHDSLGLDTIDINIGGWTMYIENNETSMAMWCGGTMGYIPDGRFIYDRILNQWVFVSSDEIMDQVIREFKLKHQPKQD